MCKVLNVLPLCYKFAYEPRTVVRRVGTFFPMHITAGYSACDWGIIRTIQTLSPPICVSFTEQRPGAENLLPLGPFERHRKHVQQMCGQDGSAYR